MTNPFNTKKPASVLDLKVEEKEVSSNFREEKTVGMTFNMPKDWHTQFKIAAAQEGMTMRDLLQVVFAEWKKNRGKTN
jgi:hypothetical protein